MQRFFDILFSFLALLILGPFLIPVSLLLLITGEGEVFYLQERIGLNGKKFNLIKFATMLKNSPSIGSGTITVKDDSRILPVGKLLRSTKINELPQLINILIGDMSVIGPRPLTIQTYNAYNSHTQKIISRVRPGLSGIGSIVFRAEENMLTDNDDPVVFYNKVIAPYKGLLEEWYVKNNSIMIYFKSIFITLLVVFCPKSSFLWFFFNDLPSPPEQLKSHLNFPSSKP